MVSDTEINSILSILLLCDCEYARKMLRDIDSRVGEDFAIIDVSETRVLSVDELMRIAKCLDKVYWRIHVELDVVIKPDYADAPVMSGRLEKLPEKYRSDYVLVIGRTKPLTYDELSRFLDDILYKPMKWVHAYVPEHEVIRCIKEPSECIEHGYLVKAEKLANVRAYVWMEGVMKEGNTTLYIISEERQRVWGDITDTWGVLRFVEWLRKGMGEGFEERITIAMRPKIQK